jgi:hypothetical protein
LVSLLLLLLPLLLDLLVPLLPMPLILVQRQVLLLQQVPLPLPLVPTPVLVPVLVFVLVLVLVPVLLVELVPNVVWLMAVRAQHTMTLTAPVPPLLVSPCAAQHGPQLPWCERNHRLQQPQQELQQKE